MIHTPQSQIVGAIKNMWDNRIDFAKYVCGMSPTNQQAEALLSLDRFSDVAHKSGTGIGKSAVESISILHYMCCRPFPKIIATAPSKHQLNDVLWAELSKWHRSMKKTDLGAMFANWFEWRKESFVHVDHPEEWFAAARTATKDNPDALRGIHADYVLRIAEEASGISNAVFDVLEGAHGRLETKSYMVGNPSRPDGVFFDAFNKLKGFYKCITSSSLESSVSDKKYIEKLIRKYGPESNIVRVQVHGEFPLTEGDSFIPYGLAMEAFYREIPAQDEFKKVFGVDIGGDGAHGDETVIAIRQGDIFYPYHRLTGKNTMQIVGYIANLANKEKPSHIFIDTIGIGAGVCDRLEELGFPVIGIKVSESPAQTSGRYRKLRDELWGLMRDWLEKRRGKLYDNPDFDLIGQLTSPKYSFSSNGEIVVDSKDKIRKDGRDSPDIADAHNLTFALPTSGYIKEDEYFSQFDDAREEANILDKEAGY